MAEPKTVRGKDEEMTARRMLDAASSMRERADRLDRFAFRKLFGEAQLADIEPAKFASAFRIAEQCEATCHHAQAGEGFVLLSGMIEDKTMAGKLAWRGALCHLSAGNTGEANQAFLSAMRCNPGEKEKMAQSAAGHFITFAKNAETGGKLAEAARALGYAAAMLKEAEPKRASVLFGEGGRLHFSAGEFSYALVAYLNAIRCDPAEAEKIICDAVPLFLEKAKELEGYHVMKLGEAAHVYSLAAELRGKISPALAHPLYMEARRLYVVVGDELMTAEMCSKAADSIAEKEPATAVRLKVEAGELRLKKEDVLGAAQDFAAAAKLLEIVDPSAALELRIRAGDLYEIAKIEDHVSRGPDVRYFSQAWAEYDAAIELARRIAPDRLPGLGAKLDRLRTLVEIVEREG